MAKAASKTAIIEGTVNQAPPETKNEVAVSELKQHNLAPAQESNPFEEQGREGGMTQIVGSLLKFSKGDWLVGRDNDEVPLGTKLVACMDTMQIGWVKWADNKPVAQVLGNVVDYFKAPNRNTLGDFDDSTWEIDDNGKARDPWQKTDFVIFRPAGLNKPPEDDELYTFTTSSTGGLGAMNKLSAFYGKEMRAHSDEFPVIELAVDSYMHPIKAYGRIKVPVLKTTGEWEPKVLVEAAKLEAPAKKTRAA